jgi:raffinose/stachyose/melibiose transport system permease protein
VSGQTAVANRPHIAHRLEGGLRLLILIATAGFVLFPIYMAVLNSLKTQGDMVNNILSIPARPQFGNYVDAFQKVDYLHSLWNNVVIVTVGVLGIVGFGSMAGYKLARTKSKLSVCLFGLFVMSMLIPFHAIMITLTQISKDLNVQGSTVGLGLIYIGLGVPLSIFLCHGFVKSIPRELEEAAILEGCNELQLFARIILPLLLPITATIAILNTLWMWNDFLLPLLMLTDSSSYTLLISTSMLFGEYGNNDWSAILASLVLTLIPVVAMYLLLQKYIIHGIAEGALKG